MKCEPWTTELEDFFYGELDAARQAAVNEHLSLCKDCRARQTALERENELFAEYYKQNALEPSDELWQAIHTRIKPKEAASLQSGWASKLRIWFAPWLAPAMFRQAGFAAFLVLISVGLTTLYFSTRKTDNDTVVELKPTPLPTATPAVEPQKQPTLAPNLKESVKPQVAALKAAQAAPKPPAPTKSEEELLAQQIAKAAREYQGAIRLLERTIAKRKTQLDESTIKQFEGSLAMIDASIASSREALRAYPNDPTAARFLLSAYSKKVELMQEIAMR